MTNKNFHCLLIVWTSCLISLTVVASGDIPLQDTIYSIRLRTGSTAFGHIVYNDSVRTTLQYKSGEIQNILNRDISNVSILLIRTSSPDPFRLYMTPGASLTTNGGGIGLTLLLINNWGFEFKYRSLSYTFPAKPDNYNPGGHEEEYCIWIFGCWEEYVYETTPDPSDLSDQYSLSVHRKYGSVSAMARWGWQAGMSYMKTSYYEFSKKSIHGPFGSNYDVTQKFSRLFGLQAGISLELPLSRYWGIEMVLLGQLNKQHNMLLLELDSPLGLVRGRRHFPRDRHSY